MIPDEGLQHLTKEEKLALREKEKEEKKLARLAQKEEMRKQLEVMKEKMKEERAKVNAGQGDLTQWETVKSK